MNKRITRLIAVSLTVVFAVTAIATAVFAKVEMTPAKKTAVEWIDANEARMTKISKAIWNYAELGWQEFKSAKVLKDFLEENGFKVENVQGAPTAFVATYGSGKPIIGILGEYDAVPMVSQKSGVPFQDPLVAIGDEVAPGHGCAHNLYGTGSASAAIAIAKAMERYNIKGTIKMFGCPSEEILEGKIYMAKEGVFDGCDSILAWHPGSANQIKASSNLALISVKFSFVGKTAHAGTVPQKGRSALDALVITDVAANYVREHMVEADRIQCVFTKGGVQPNVVPDFAEVWYFLRAPDVTEVRDLLRRITNCAKAGAIATDTEMKRQIVTGCWPGLPNLRLAQLGWDNLELLGIPQFTEKEQAFAKEVQRNAGLPEKGMATTLAPRPTGIGKQGRSSNDKGDITWQAPFAYCRAASNIIGAVGHSWQVVVGANTSAGMKGMRKSAQVIAATAIDLFMHPEIIDEAKAEFKERSKGVKYESLLGPESKPSLDHFTGEMAKFGPLMEEYYTSPK